ncbi:sigma-70 family RNA polymerase sigma factor [Acinetobacter qingfengensis]|nr:sigma-70 family RNA polymerase sigma factor [Acinetobacter qingfengensis]KAA8734679.1 sigma-70 family RNA polymerase sigma factor [Acinetobacter qingfengensis]
MKIMTSSDMIANLYKDHYSWLYHWLRKTLSSKDRAEDVLQDTFIKIIQSKDILNIQKPQNYIYSTAKRIIIDQSRRQKIEQAYLDYLTQFVDESYQPSPEQAVLAIETLDQMAVVLDSLEQRARQILLMHYMDGLKQSEIAEILQISVKTVQRDLVKGLLHCHQSNIF